MCDNVDSGNPFAGLFSTVNDPPATSTLTERDADKGSRQDDKVQDMESSVEEKAEETFSSDIPHTSQKEQPANYLLRHAFGITLNAQPSDKYRKLLVFIDTDSVEHAVFERLMLADPEERVVPKIGTKGWICESHTLQRSIIPYLFESFSRLQQYKKNDKLKEAASELCRVTLRNVGTALQEPGLFEGQEVMNKIIIHELGITLSP